MAVMLCIAPRGGARGAYHVRCCIFRYHGMRRLMELRTKSNRNFGRTRSMGAHEYVAGSRVSTGAEGQGRARRTDS